MRQSIEFNLAQQVALLDSRNLEDLRLFVEFLLSRQQNLKKRKKTRARRVLADLETIPMSINNVLIHREALYDNRL